MTRNIFFFLKLITLILIFNTNIQAEELTIIPAKKPIFDKITTQQKLTQGILRPKSKPIIEKENKKISTDIIKPETKPTKDKEKKVTENVKEKIETTENKDTKITTKTKQKVVFIFPKNKPVVVKKSTKTVQKKSKYYNQKDFEIAKKSINAIEKRQWTTAVSMSKKTKDKSIYKFIQWRHLLTTGNQASFYDYMTFIKIITIIQE